MASFGDQLQAFAERTKQDIDKVDRAFKLSLFNRVVSYTRVAAPETWIKPDPTYKGGTMRGGWQVGNGSMKTNNPNRINTSTALPAADVAQIRPASLTYLTNNVPYAFVYEEKDMMIARAVADAVRALNKAVSEVRR